ncbi:hypothetical protein DR64_6825 [Paraburkholderia xenovorans LB400]|uniref:hypothetical protein n=1 Tax=Paraburkholderia xenovorans TaxID=36873 RepID=UPI000037D62A|nr:hypothetical protein [Paraburkholderia xenovorans]AIP37543.1 hypothetical protein DR64_6825 [Paraburkholderia xenovorans LB400]NPT33246.1 hypothetical protein [Paraburkholderia xenovorans]
MTNAIWGIVIAMALMFGIAFYRSTHQRQPAAHPRGPIRQQTQDRLRKRYGL